MRGPIRSDGGTVRPTAPPLRGRCCSLCSIMGRCWAVQAFQSDPDHLTLCLGSYFDDVSLEQVLKYTRGQNLRCGRCLRMG